MLAQGLTPDQSAGEWVLLAIAALGSITTIIVALINARRSKGAQDNAQAAADQSALNQKVAREAAREVLEQLDTGNGHTVGQAAARHEEQIATVLDRVDTVEVLAREGLEVAREGLGRAQAVEIIATEARDAATVSADALQTHLFDIEQDRSDLKEIKRDWDAVKRRVLGPKD